MLILDRQVAVGEKCDRDIRRRRTRLVPDKIGSFNAISAGHINIE